MPATTERAIVAGVIEDRRFVRLYLVSAEQAQQLEEAAKTHDYVFAYSLVDLGDPPGFKREFKATQLITLEGDTEEVFAGLNKNNRYKVRRSYRDEGIDVVVDDPDRAGSLGFYQAVKTADGVIPDIDEDFTSVRWINAYRAGEMISSTCWFDSGQVLRAKHIVSTRKEEGSDPALIGRLTRRLFWEACLLGISEGRLFVDLGGVDITDTSKTGVADFKLSFGGDTVDVFVYRRSTPEWDDLAQRLHQNGRAVV